MCSCSYLGSPCAAERAIPARPRCGVAHVSRPRCGVVDVSTASPRDEVALFSPGVRSCAHPRLGEVPGEHALPPRGARARGGSKLTVPRALPRLRSSRREAPRRGGTCCPGAPAPPALACSTPAQPCASAFFFNVWITSGEFRKLGAVDCGRCCIGNGQGTRGVRCFCQRRVVHQSSCMLAALTHSNLI